SASKRSFSSKRTREATTATVSSIGYSPQSSSGSGASASRTGSVVTTSSSLRQSGHSTISFIRTASAKAISRSHSGQVEVTFTPPSIVVVVSPQAAEHAVDDGLRVDPVVAEQELV